MPEPHPVALIVEDEKQIRRFVRAALEDQGWLVHEADTVARGLSEASTRRPDLIVLDLGLPDSDGLEFLRDLRATVSASWTSHPAAARRRGAGKEDLPPIFEFGDVIINMSLRTVQKGGSEIHLTPTEYRLLCLLAANAGKVLTHHQLLTDVWGPSRSKDGHYLRVYMGHLRQKLESDPARPRHILTEPAVGYRLVQKPRHPLGS